MPRSQGCNCHGVVLSSMFVQRDEDYGFETDGPSLTRQEFADECDVNALMARYEKTGEMIPSRGREPVYLDLSEVPDLHLAMNVMRQAEDAFMTLPAGVRLRFENDVQEFVTFAEDPENLDQMRAWGLAKPAEQPPKPVQVEVINSSVGGEATPGGASAAPAKSS